MISPRAEEEFKASFTWYFLRNELVADNFMAQLILRLKFISNNPKSFPVTKDIFREATLFNFPFKIIYVWDEKNVIIHSIFHCKRNPQKKFKK